MLAYPCWASSWARRSGDGAALLRLRARDVARQLAANPDTVKNWEVGNTAPALWFVPRLIRFLGYIPVDTTGDSLPLSDRLKTFRRVRGLSQKQLAAMLGVDPSTLARWEHGRGPSNEVHSARLRVLLRCQREEDVDPQADSAGATSAGTLEAQDHPPSAPYST